MAETKLTEHEDRIERLNKVFYIRWTSGPNYERAFLCVEDGEPDMNEFAEVSFGMATLFKAGMLALESLPPTSPPPWFTEQFLASRHFTAANTIDIIARKDAREYRLEGDWLKTFVAATVSETQFLPMEDGEFNGNENEPNDLSPCPFCGGEAERVELTDEDNFGGSVICCKGCGASSPVHFDRKENLLDSWNRREALRQAQDQG